MKTKLLVLKGVVLLCTTTLLFACSEADDLAFTDEIDVMQGRSSQADDDVFVGLDKATEVADLFFSELTGTSVLTRSGGSTVQTVSDSVQQPLMYVVNYADGGFVIMGSSRNYYPVLAYSDEGSFQAVPDMGGVSEWLEETKGAIQTSETLNDSIKAFMQGLWYSYEPQDVILSRSMPKTRALSAGELACQNKCLELLSQYGSTGWVFVPLSYAPELLANSWINSNNWLFPNLFNDANYNSSPAYTVFAFRFPSNSGVSAGPLLTTQWHQDYPFDYYCDGHPAGCGAVALAQVMNYHQHPQSFPFNGNAISMSSVENSSLNKAALAKYVRDLVNTHNFQISALGWDFAWATPDDMQDGMEVFYNVTRSNHNSDNVKGALLSHRPVIMGGNSWNLSLFGDPISYLGESHYWVCDGVSNSTSRFEYFVISQPGGFGTFIPGAYSVDNPAVITTGGIDYFHMNWGWGNGNGENAWYVSNNVNSGNGNFQHSRLDFYLSVKE
jgi:hypothetical protein